MRCATVDGVVRKACAISSVVRPHTSRSVSATWASGVNAGWQHVKISRRRSSSTVSSSHAAAIGRRGFDSRSPAHPAPRRIGPAGACTSIALKRPGRHEPGPRILGHAVLGPSLDRGDERIVERFLGAVEVAEQANQRREDTPRLGAVDGLDRLAARSKRSVRTPGWAGPRCCRCAPTESSARPGARRSDPGPRSGSSRPAAPSSRRTVRQSWTACRCATARSWPSGQAEARCRRGSGRSS